MLNGKYLVENGIVTGHIDPETNIQQHGVDLNVVAISKVVSSGAIWASEKKSGFVPPTKELYPGPLFGIESKQVWKLETGMYKVTFSQGCNIPSNMMGQVVHRSSVNRNGGWITSPLWDAGFETDMMSTFMLVTVPIAIEYNSRLAQFYCHTAGKEIENLYKGQFQGK